MSGVRLTEMCLDFILFAVISFYLETAGHVGHIYRILDDYFLFVRCTVYL